MRRLLYGYHMILFCNKHMAHLLSRQQRQIRRSIAEQIASCQDKCRKINPADLGEPSIRDASTSEQLPHGSDL